MKKILIIIVTSLLPVFAYAQEWRGFKGFVDFYIGASGGTGYDFRGTPAVSFSNVKNKITCGFNFTGGYQVFSSLFAGVGFGFYTNEISYLSYEVEGDYGFEMDSATFYSFYYPVFADLRWTLNINSRVTPFVDLKIGYQFGIPITEGDLGYYYNGDVYGDGYEVSEVVARHRPGFYLLPSIGVRFGKRSAFNLGVAYNPFIGKEFVLIQGAGEGQRPVEKVVGKSSTGSFLVTLGADF